MSVFVVVEEGNGMMGGETIGVYTSKEKAIKKIILLNKKYFDKLDESTIQKKDNHFYGHKKNRDKTEIFNDFKKRTKEDLEENNHAYGFYDTAYEIRKHKLDK